MGGTLNPTVRYRWIVRIDAHHGSTVEGDGDSAGVLGDCFAMWVQNRGDLSKWADAPRLGAIVTAYGDLSCPVVAVWLGIEPEAIRSVGTPAFDPPWTLTLPDGDALTVDRRIVRASAADPE